MSSLLAKTSICWFSIPVYSNTGGQATRLPLGAIAQFAAQGKRIRKKDLGLIATTYGYVCSSGGYGRRQCTMPEGYPRGRGLSRSVTRHRLRTHVSTMV